ncbi:gephyrin-like molybdotransferase Glp [Neisseria leonii]|uniref:Molybdopterin molybdenumtransferase n=1 Tax=Neisseria leonii TaxID=2995413 RepID=A0A9X4E0K7_9NEIS|nr:gephyrin-like molybdotransferase Glp [Neisseria sp. 51.81]MDD9327262.1 molybdopterin molybdotransferase MoeA [Neisseria sp. 51.81]
MALMSVADLQQLISTRIGEKMTLPETETAAVAQAAGRVLAADILSPIHVPEADVSAMDGYALPCAASCGDTFEIVGESAAGQPFSDGLAAGQCVRIMTGAVVPGGCAAVVMQENAALGADGRLRVLQDTPAACNIRFAGEEIRSGMTVLHKGRILRHADVMLLAALGLGRVPVYRRLRVAVLSTGNELTEAGEPLAAPGRIYDSNRPMLMSRLRDFPVETVDLKCVRDNLDDVIRVLDEAAQNHDVVMTSGGVSVGDYDYMREAVLRLGAIHHYKVAMKPGKPFVFGQMFRTWYFGLPGNPVSGFAGFDVFVKAALWQLCGACDIPQPLRFQAALTAPVAKSAGRLEMQRAVIARQADGSWTAAPCGAQDSHRILGASRANAYMILPPQAVSLNIGDQVEVQPFGSSFL